MLFTRLDGTTRIESNTFQDKLAGLNAGYNHNNESNPATAHYATGVVYIQHNVILDNVGNDPPQFAIWVVQTGVQMFTAGNKITTEDVEVITGEIPASDE